MECASSWVDLNADEEDEYEFAEADALVPTSSAPGGAPPAAKTAGLNRQKRKFRKANTNVIAIQLGTLTEDVVMCTGDPFFCNSCRAAFSYLDVNRLSTCSSKPKSDDNMETDEGSSSSSSTSSTATIVEGGKNWQCQYCDAMNTLELDEEEYPKSESVDYMLEPPPTQSDSKSNSEDTKTLIFCIDISGSMCVSTEVSGKFSLKGNNINKLAQLNTEGADQRWGNQKADVTYVSRLQAVQAAVSTQLEAMAQEQPNRRIGLITFNNEVTIYGDGSSSEPVTVAGDKLKNYEDLIEVGAKSLLTKSIKDSEEALTKRLFNLEESGPTALGPALCCAVGMAGLVKGSEIVICTDGLANVGIGALDAKPVAGQAPTVNEFYANIGRYASEKGVTVSVLSIEGDDCRLESLGVVSDLTNGEVTIVNPLKIVSEFKRILSVPVIATNCSVKLFLNNGLYIRDTNESGTKKESGSSSTSSTPEKSKDSIMVKDIGNVTSESVFTVEYGVKNAKGLSPETLKRDKLPFQLHIQYTKLNGMKCIRIISKEQPVTWDKNKAEADAKVDLLGLNAVQTTAKIAQEGSYTGARFNNFTYMSLLDRTAAKPEQRDAYKKWATKGEELETGLQTAQIAEQREGLFLDSADYEASRNTERRNVRGNRRDDKTANMLWNAVSKKKK